MGRVVSLVMAVAAVVGVFTYLPWVSEYAFWVLAAAIILYLGSTSVKGAFSLGTIWAVLLLLVAVVSVFVEVPVVSNFAFWVLVIAYLILVRITG
jgi:hypothetical protein